MEPLDLTKTRPRSAREQLDGLAVLPRTIDKLRATLEGGNLGPYQIQGFSTRMLHGIGIDDIEPLREAVRNAKDDNDVVQWLRKHADTSKYSEITERLLNRSVGDVQDRADFERRYPIVKRRPDLHYIVDVLDADDDELFAAPKSHD